MRLTMFLAILSSLSLASCGVFDTEKKGQKATQVDTSLPGSWATNCLSETPFDLSHSVRTVAFSALGDFTRTETYFGSDACDSPAFAMTINGTYEVPEKPEDENASGTLNLTVTKAEVEVHSDDAVDILNTLSLCGIDNWQKDERIDITGKECGTGYIINNGDVIFERYSLRNDRLYLGNTYLFMSEDSAKDRPSSVNSDIVYEKK